VVLESLRFENNSASIYESILLTLTTICFTHPGM